MKRKKFEKEIQSGNEQTCVEDPSGINKALRSQEEGTQWANKQEPTNLPAYSEIEQNQDLEPEKMSDSMQGDTSSVLVRNNMTEKRK